MRCGQCPHQLRSFACGARYRWIRGAWRGDGAGGGGQARVSAPARAGITYIAFARAQPAAYLLMFGPELEKSAFPPLIVVAGRSFEALREAIDGVVPEPSRRVAAIGAWALVHGLSHLIADNQLPMDLAGEDKRDVLTMSWRFTGWVLRARPSRIEDGCRRGYVIRALGYRLAQEFPGQCQGRR
jgi:Tetracyclin repressor-like, C-terminal domain